MKNLVLRNLLFFSKLVLVFSCSSYQKISKEFVFRKQKPIILYFSQPQVFIDFFRPENKFHNLYYYPEKITYFIEDLGYDMIVFNYDSVFTSKLQELGFNIYRQHELTDFFSDTSERWMIRLAQISLEERREVYQDVLTLGTEEYVWDTIISVYYFNIWFEFIPVNHHSDVSNFLLFAATYISDQISGFFIYDSKLSTYIYEYTFIPILKAEFLDLIKESAMLHAQYTFDFFMNLYLRSHKKFTKKKQLYFTWDWNRNRLKQSYYNRFIFL